LAQVFEHQARRPEGNERVGDAPSGDIEGRPVNGLEHGGETAFRVQVGGRADADGSGQGDGEIGQDVLLQVGGGNGVKGAWIEGLRTVMASTSILSQVTSGNEKMAQRRISMDNYWRI